MTAKAMPGVCSNCGGTLCGRVEPLIAIHCRRHKVSNAVHHSDGTYAHEHCARPSLGRQPTLVEVKGCEGCWLMNDDPHGDYNTCGHGASPTDNDVRVYTLLAERQPADRPGWCPLLEDGRPNAGVRIVAIIEEVEG